jgi:cysteine sulfinate desulfinase/cysteine desulfurase-like protein
MLFGETVAVYCENHTEHTDTLCGQNAEFWYVNAGGTNSDNWAVKGYITFRSQNTRSISDRIVQVRIPVKLNLSL